MHGVDALRMALLAASVALAGCAAPGASGGEAKSLAGTRWRLAAIQSMADDKPAPAIGEGATYTLAFEGDGSASFRLDCNRGRGTWRAVPAASGNSGTIEFGPLAMTRALCPPPRLDERIARDMGYVRSYVLRDGRLYLSLMADGGIYEWVPQ